MYKLLKEDVELLEKLFNLKDWNKADGYVKSEIVNAVKTNDKMDKDMLNQIRNYVMDKNLEYGFDDDEPNELGYATEELSDRLYSIIESK